MKLIKPTEVFVRQFTEESAQDFKTRIQEAAYADPNQPIFVQIDSYGGSVDALIKMVETIDACPNKIITYTTGKAMSCGAVLLSHGDERFIGKYSRVLIHQASGFLIGNVEQVKSDLKELDKINNIAMGILAKNCGKTLKELKAAIGPNDVVVRGKKAVEFGVVDYIGTPAIITAPSTLITLG